MKKLVRVLALAIALVMLLSSCSSSKKGKGTDIGSLLNANAPYEDEYVVFNDADEITELAGAEFQEQAGNLLYFIGETSSKNTDITYDRHIIYNLDTASTVYTANESKKTAYSIEFGELDEFPYFVVTKTTYKLDEYDEREDVAEELVTLCDYLGNEVTSFAYAPEIITVEDVLYVEGKCYREDETGKLTEAFEYSILSAFPEGIDAKVNGKYFDIVDSGDKGIKIYDDKFAFAKEYEIPTYADLLSVTFLKGDKLLIQYVYELDEDDKKFSFIFEGEELQMLQSNFEFKSMSKYNLETVIYDITKEKVEEIDCPYVIASTLMGVEDEDTLEMLNEDAAQALVWGYAIADERLKGDYMSVRALGIDNKTKLFEVDQINGEAVLFVDLIAEGKWEIYTENFKYLYSNGAMVGEVSKAYNNGALYATENGNFFDMDLKALYNCRADGTEIADMLNGAFLLTNKKDETFFYGGGDSATKLIDDEDIETISYVPVSGDIFAIIDASDEDGDITCTFYNTAGEEIIEIDYSIFASITGVLESENAALVTYTDSEGEVTFYRFFKK